MINGQTALSCDEVKTIIRKTANETFCGILQGRKDNKIMWEICVTRGAVTKKDAKIIAETIKNIKFIKAQ